MEVSFSSLPGTNTPKCSAGKWEQENPRVPQLQPLCPPKSKSNPFVLQIQPLCLPNSIPASHSSSSPCPPNPTPVSSKSKSSPCVPQLQLLCPPNPSPESLQVRGPSALQKINPAHSGIQSPPDNSQVVFLDHPSEQREEGARESRMGVEFTMQRDPSSAGLPLLTPVSFSEQPKGFQVAPHFFLRILGFFTGRR